MANSKSFFLNRDRRYLQISYAIFLTCLAGCGNDDLSDLNQYIAKVKAVPKGKIQPLPEIAVVKPFTFNPKDLRDPFKALELPEGYNALPELSTGGGLKPDTTRRKEELEAFPLETLQMVGTVTMKSTLWGLVKADDGTIYRVQVGNYMGKNYGKISRMSADKIEILEIVPDKPGKWREQLTTLPLTE